MNAPTYTFPLVTGTVQYVITDKAVTNSRVIHNFVKAAEWPDSLSRYFVGVGASPAQVLQALMRTTITIQ